MAWLHDLSEWLLGFAESGWAIGILVVSTFTESIFNPIPPDPLLIAIAVLQPHNAIWLALIATEKYIARAELMFVRYGVWAVLVAAFTPVPYKVFAILAGILGFDRKLFLIVSLIGRGARFLIIGALIMAFGEEIETFVEGNFETITWAVGGAIIAAVAAFVIFRVYRSRQSVGRGEAPS